MSSMSTISVVVLTMGDRPDELAASISSARAQKGVSVEIVLVINGGTPDQDLADVIVEPKENMGIPEGRNIGAAASKGEFICFLDDDGVLLDENIFLEANNSFSFEEDLAVVSLKIVNEHNKTVRRHHSGLIKEPSQKAEITAFAGGACLIRKTSFDSVEGFSGEFFYGLEETDLAWRLIDENWKIRYLSNLLFFHPSTSPMRHKNFHLNTARNRVWLVHRLLPFPLAIIYLTNWFLVSAIRNLLRPSNLYLILAGYFQGWESRPFTRSTLKKETLIRLTKLGRPPII